MIGLIKENEAKDNLIAIKIEGQLTGDDYDNTLPEIEKRIKDSNNVRLYCEVKNVQSIEPEAIWKDLKFDAKHFNDFEKIAVVGDKEWVEWLTKFSKPFVKGSVKHFDSDHKDAAWNWLKSS